MTTPIKLIDFLKKYTAISHKFIKEYYKFYEISEFHSFGIKLDDVLEYLEINDRNKFYDRFRKKFTIELSTCSISLNSLALLNTRSFSPNSFLPIETFCPEICS